MLRPKNLTIKRNLTEEDQDLSAGTSINIRESKTLPNIGNERSRGGGTP